MIILVGKFSGFPFIETKKLTKELQMEQIKNTKFIKNKYLRYADFKCHCGKIFTALISNIEKNKQKSCGCLRATRHGESSSRLYGIYSCMKSRCYSENNTGYKWYGALNIKVCKEWLDDYSNFEKWALENGYSDDLSIDRIDGKGDYEPSNCRWATRTEQARNRVLFKSNTTGFIGVSYDKKWKKYKARICVDYKQIHLGTFKTAIEASDARDEYIDMFKTGHTKNNKELKC